MPPCGWGRSTCPIVAEFCPPGVFRMFLHHGDVTVKTAAKRASLVGRHVWLHHQRGRAYFERIGPSTVPLIVVDEYPGIVVVRSLGDVSGPEYHVKASAISVTGPRDAQIAAEAARREATR